MSEDREPGRWGSGVRFPLETRTHTEAFYECSLLLTAGASGT